MAGEADIVWFALNLMDVAYDNMHPPSSETGTGVPFVKAQALKVLHLIMEGCALLRSDFPLICFQTSLHNQQHNNIQITYIFLTFLIHIKLEVAWKAKVLH